MLIYVYCGVFQYISISYISICMVLTVFNLQSIHANNVNREGERAWLV